MEELTQGNLSLLALITALLPLLSFLGILMVPGRQGRGASFSIVTIALSFIIAVFIFFKVWNSAPVHQQIHWFTIGTSEFKAGILLNNLSVLMLVLVTAIALLVHIYSTKYMRGDAYLHRYWAYLSLFCFSMLGLVITDSLFLLYIFWELVGFSSYLLIGFWFTRDSASQASKKAFIMNRIGDLGFLTALMIIYAQFKTLDINLLFRDGGLVTKAVIEHGLWINGTNSMTAIWLTIAGLAFFLGAIAKSAQFPLHTWLPDAMEGPTSVSALIHAATMVAAGVFLLGRVYLIFDSTVLLIIAATGAFTAFMAATIALTQNDIKRILAFSTISQLGFMMIAMGAGAYSAGIFHLVTHAFFKCLLFLGAGAVIHEMAHLKENNSLDFDHQSIQNMGGLRKKMPVTFITMVLASLALIGIPLTSGYLSKDAILIRSFKWSELQNNWVRLIPYSAMLTSWLTAFYISRLVFKVFFGDFRLAKQFNMKLTLHEVPGAMKYVLILLAAFCLFPVFSFHPVHFDDAWIINGFPAAIGLERADVYHIIIPITVNVVAFLLIYLAYHWYAKRSKSQGFTWNVIFRISEKQWYFNEFYQRFFVRGTITLSESAYHFDKIILDRIVNSIGKAGIILSVITHWIDKYIIDGLINGIVSMTRTIGNFTRHFQTGRLQHYLFSMVLVVLTFFIIKYLSQAI